FCPHDAESSGRAAAFRLLNKSFSAEQVSDAELLLERVDHFLILLVLEQNGLGICDGKAAAKLKAALVLRDDMEMQMRVGVAERAEVELGAAPQLLDRAGRRRQIGHVVVALLIVALAQLLLVAAQRE